MRGACPYVAGGRNALTRYASLAWWRTACSPELGGPGDLAQVRLDRRRDLGMLLLELPELGAEQHEHLGG